MVLLRDLFDMDLLVEMMNKGMVNRQYHPRLPLAILNYSHECQFAREWNDVTTQCRGLIYNVDNTEVVARPFRKFFNAEELGPSKLGQALGKNVLCMDKADGSLGILYPDSTTVTGLAIATRGSFTSEQAQWATWWFNKYANVPLFDQEITYLFEILVRWNRIVLEYDWEGLVLLGMRDTEDGFYYDLPEDPWLLQARTPRDDIGEYVRPSQ
jgi:RNA ligase